MFIPLWSILTLFDAKTPVLALVGEICLGQSGGLSVRGGGGGGGRVTPHFRQKNPLP